MARHHKVAAQLGLWEVLEIFQLSILLFFCALLGSFLISLPFTELDKAIDHIKDNDTLFMFSKIAETFLQLFVTAVVYFYIEKLVYQFPSISDKLSKRYVAWTGANYAVHIVLILILIEMNQSLVNGVHTIATRMQINGGGSH